MKKINNISSEAVKKATGKGWDEWLKIIDKADGREKDHKEIVAYLDENYELTGWWKQTVTVGYEHATGKRVTGETADAGFQLGVQKTVNMKKDEVWELLTSEQGIRKWLGDTNIKFKKGEDYETKKGTSGEIRVVKSGKKIRLTWKPRNWKSSSTLQIRLFNPNNKDKTSIRIHHEKLPDKEARENLKEYWKDVLKNMFNSA